MVNHTNNGSNLKLQDISDAIRRYVGRTVPPKFAAKVKKAALKLAFGNPDEETQKLESYCQRLQESGHYVKLHWETAEETIAGIKRAISEEKDLFEAEQSKFPPFQRKQWPEVAVDFSKFKPHGRYFVSTSTFTLFIWRAPSCFIEQVCTRVYFHSSVGNSLRKNANVIFSNDTRVLLGC